MEEGKGERRMGGGEHKLQPSSMRLKPSKWLARASPLSPLETLPSLAGFTWPCSLDSAHLSLQCSVSCGAGTQRRKQVCQRLTAKGRHVAVSEAMCRALPGFPLVRSCQMPACSSKYATCVLHQDRLTLLLLSPCLSRHQPCI